MKSENLTKTAIINSIGVLIYTSMVVLFMDKANKIFGQSNNFMSGLLILLLLVISATVVGMLVLGKPLLMYLDGEKKNAISLFAYTLLSLFVIFIIVSSIYLLIK